MNVIIHDLTDLQFQQIFPQIIGDPRIVSNKGSIRNCIGCFGCWIKTPGQCVMKDGYENMVSRNSINFNASKHDVAFFNSIEQLCGKVGKQ